LSTLQQSVIFRIPIDNRYPFFKLDDFCQSFEFLNDQIRDFRRILEFLLLFVYLSMLEKVPAVSAKGGLMMGTKKV